MGLTSMKLPEKTEKKSFPEVWRNSDKYPYGLKITLDKAILKKLGLTAKDFKSGETVTLEAVAQVYETSDRTSIESGDNQSVSLQITKMGVSKQPKKGNALAKPRS